VEDLQDVMGMTSDIYQTASPYLTTLGTGQVNLNTAPVPVLRALPGMTDATINKILQLRSQGGRITSVGEIFSQQGTAGGRGGRPLPGQLGGQAVINALNSRAGVQTREVELTITSRAGPQAPPAKLTAVINNQGTVARITYKQW
jgi:type II secretory pathway component PulK